MKSNEVKCSVKYHETYCEVGHKVTYTPIVLYSDYWWNYKILSSIDVATYVTLQFFCKKSMSFTPEWLAKESKCSIGTLQQRFDNLENAELLKTLKADQQGAPNRLILLTPRSSLEKDFQRLKRQVEENHAKHLRELHGKQSKSLLNKIKFSVEKNIGLAK